MITKHKVTLVNPLLHPVPHLLNRFQIKEIQWAFNKNARHLAYSLTLKLHARKHVAQRYQLVERYAPRSSQLWCFPDYSPKISKALSQCQKLNLKTSIR